MKNLIFLFGLLSVPGAALLTQAQAVPGADSIALQATVAGKHGGPVTRRELLDAGKIVLGGNDTAMRVLSFKMTVICKEPGGMWQGEGYHTDQWGNPECVSGSEGMTVEMRRALTRAKPGCKVYFESIRAGGAQGPDKGVIPMAFVLE